MSTSRVQEYLSSIPIVTKSLLLFNIAVHVALFVTSFPVNDLAINPLVILVRGEYYRMVSSAFVHGGLMHIGMNMSTLLAIGSSLESQYGTLPMLFLTLWCLLLCGGTFVFMVWLYAVCSAQPSALNTSAVGYSGVLFSYALIEAFHSAETSRSVFGMFSVPTKAYPFILLALIQVLMPNISFWGHLSGLLVGVLLISRVGAGLFMPSYEGMVYLEQTAACCRPLVLCSGYVPVRDKDLVHSYLQCGGGSGGAGLLSCCSAFLAGTQWAISAVGQGFLFIWQILAHVMVAVGVPAGVCRKMEEMCHNFSQYPCAIWQQGCGGCWRCITGAQAYVPVQTSDTDAHSPHEADAEQGIQLTRHALVAGTASSPDTPSAASGLAATARVSGHKQIVTGTLPDVHTCFGRSLHRARALTRYFRPPIPFNMKRKAVDLEKNEVPGQVQFEDVESDEDPPSNDSHAHSDTQARVKCPYLDTINRQSIDFDSEKLCSVTLTNMNVYVCLVCGKYFQGRGKMTPAYTHSVQAGHFVFMNLHSGRAFCLPDGYEVTDSSLHDVQKCLSPTYSLGELVQLNSNTSLARDVHGVSYLPGFVGLNNLNCTDYLNSLLHALAHVAPFRDFWLQSEHYALSKSTVTHQFGLALRKMWSSNNFKSTVSPQELVQELSVESKRRFSIGQRAECLDLLVWLLGTLHKGLGKAANAPAALPSTHNNGSNGSKPIRPSAPDASSSVVYEPFQGVIEVTTLTKRLVSSAEELAGEKKELGAGETVEGEWVRSVAQVPFTYLSLDIPPCPLFRDSEGGLVIPQVPLFEVLKKFDGSTWTDTMTSEAHVRRQYRILQLPRYLVLHLVRFTRNNFYLEKNPTIVTFPVKNLEMKEFLQVPAAPVPAAVEANKSIHVDGSADKAGPRRLSLGERKAREEARLLQTCPSAAQVETMSSLSLRQFIAKHGSDLHKLQVAAVAAGGSDERQQLQAIGRSAAERVQLFGATKYDLLANICHGSDASSSSTKGGVTVGDLNMLLGQSSNGSHKGKAAANAKAAAGSGAAGVVGAGSSNGGGSGGADSTNGGSHSAYTSTSALSTNNRVLNEGVYRVHLQHKASGQWFEIQDLHVTEVTPQLIGVSESNILIYEKKPAVLAK